MREMRAHLGSCLRGEAEGVPQVQVAILGQATEDERRGRNRQASDWQEELEVVGQEVEQPVRRLPVHGLCDYGECVEGSLVHLLT